MVALNQKVFFSHVREGPFPGKLTKQQVEGMNGILAAWELCRESDLRFLAYILATAYHETGARMAPVREGFASTDAKARAAVNRLAQKRGPNSAVARYAKPHPKTGHVYYGRGHVQLTWFENYAKMQGLLGIPLVDNPDLALDPKHSARILIEGMTRGVSSKGDFTGKSLEDYFNQWTSDPVGARRVVNGTDKAQLIAGYYAEFLEAVTAAQRAYEEPKLELADPLVDDETHPRTKPPVTDQTSWGGIATTVGGTAASVTAVIDRIDDPYALAAFGMIALLIAGGALLMFRGRLKLVRETGE